MERNTIFWNHNTHYHAFLLSQIPKDTKIALDIGCGIGDFTRLLAIRCERVIGLDPDKKSIEQARILSKGIGNASFIYASFEETAFEPASIDIIVLIASMHHLELSSSLIKMKEILKTGGKLLVLGLYKEHTFLDFVNELIAMPISYVLRRIKNRKGQKHPHLVISDPEMTMKEIRLGMKAHLPGCDFRRRLFWRYSVVWRKSS